MDLGIAGKRAAVAAASAGLGFGAAAALAAEGAQVVICGRDDASWATMAGRRAGNPAATWTHNQGSKYEVGTSTASLCSAAIGVRAR